MSRFSCHVIGADSLLVECVEVLLREGHEVRSVVTGTARIANWARERGLTVLDVTDDYPAHFAASEFDFLFSITHLGIHKPELLRLPRRGAINFHDGPLPRYAGLNAPAWALIEGATEYAITWHRIVDAVDEGDILERVPVAIGPGETSLTLNTKCFEAGIDGFRRLVRRLGEGDFVGQRQDVSQKTYFGRHRRPPRFGLLDWSRPATELAACVHGLDFGRYPNLFGAAKLVHRGRAFVVTTAEVVDGTGRPGEVIGIDAQRCVVACAEGALAMRGFQALDGTAVGVDVVATTLHLRPGLRLDELAPDTVARIESASEALSRAEFRWLSRLRRFAPTRLPHAKLEAPAGGTPHWVRHGFELPAAFTGADGETRLVCAFAAFVARSTGTTDVGLAIALSGGAHDIPGGAAWLLDHAPWSVRVDTSVTLAAFAANVASELATLRSEPPMLRDLIGRQPDLHERHELRGGGLAPLAFANGSVDPLPGSTATLQRLDARSAEWVFDGRVLPPEMARVVVGQFRGFLQNLADHPERALGDVELVAATELDLVLHTWNATGKPFRDDVCVQRLFEEQVERAPEAIALVVDDEEWTYRRLDARANQLAAVLRERGVGRGSLVGICVPRSSDLVVAVLATWKADAAYLPLDPAFPRDRLSYMVEDARCVVVLAHEGTATEFAGATTLYLDRDAARIDAASTTAIASTAGARDLAYVIYTSGSTGKPKGVMVEHRSVVNFLAGMDERIPRRDGDAWLAVTSLSFDISVLELAWPLSRGLRLVLFGGVKRAASKSIAFSLSYFASNAGESAAAQYELLLAGAKFADAHGFHAVWTPERHFHAFGGLYPNPAVTSAALASVTRNVKLRAGSVVVALHHPIRIAEEWSLVDNLSNGRVGVSIASGWHPNDFVLAPTRYQERRDIMVRDTDVVRRLWRGEAVEFADPNGKLVPTRIMPKPIQDDLPIWVTAAGNPDTFELAGRIGANVLTHLLGQRPEELERKIGIYRDAWRKAGHPGRGQVSLMLHTFVGPDRDAVKETVRGPMREYLRSAADLIKNHVATWAPVRTSLTVGGSDTGIRSLDDLAPEDLEALLDFSFERYYDDNALFGTPESCAPFVVRLHGLGVDEICCLVDFGVPSQTVLQHLPHLERLKDEVARRLAGDEPQETVPSLIGKRGITHLQCTPSMATMLAEDPESARMLGRLQVMMVGGEALSPDLARKLAGLVGGRLLNMYGPTETTIWSTTAECQVDLQQVTIGKPIVNTQLYVLDARMRPAPIGVPGELYIGGDGVTRGYHARPELTDERFVADPFGGPGRRLYRTGDLVRWLPNGEVEFLGRVDHQVKVRGYRIELGEIEAALASHPAVLQTVVATRQTDAQDVRLIAYATLRDGVDAKGKELQEHARRFLPDYMVPSEVVLLAEMPMTPNGKIDRKGLATARRRLAVVSSTPISGVSDCAVGGPSRAAVDSTAAALPNSAPMAPPTGDELAPVLKAIWCDVLGLADVGRDDNFFDLGGHSLLTIKVQSRLKDRLGLAVPLVELFRHTTLARLEAHLGATESSASTPGADRASAGAGSAGGATDRGQQRAALRRQALARRPPGS